MLIGVLSDTHDRLPIIDAALELFARRKVAALIHPGDFVDPFAVRSLLNFKGPILATYGNNDWYRSGLKKLSTEYATSVTRMEAMAKATGARVEPGSKGKSRAVWDLSQD